MDQKIGVDQENYRDFFLAVSIIVLLNKFLYGFAESFYLSDVLKCILFGSVSLVALTLGLFKFHKSLKFGLALGGIVAGHFAYEFYHFKLTDTFKFVVVMLLLMVLCFALYKLYISSQSTQKGK